MIIIYLLKCIYKSKCCGFKPNILHSQSAWMAFMEELYKDDDKKAECKSLEDYIDNYEKTNEPIFTKILCKFHICLGCRYTLWER